MRNGRLVWVVLLAACSIPGAPADPSAPDPGPGGDSNPGSTPNPAVVTVGGCQVFPADNAWNRDVSADPADPASDALLAQLSPNTACPLDLAPPKDYYATPSPVVPESQPRAAITY